MALTLMRREVTLKPLAGEITKPLVLRRHYSGESRRSGSRSKG